MDEERSKKIVETSQALPMPRPKPATDWEDNTEAARQCLSELAPLTWEEFLLFHHHFKYKAGHSNLGKVYDRFFYGQKV